MRPKLNLIGPALVAVLAAALLATPAAAKTTTKTFQNATPVPIPDAVASPGGTIVGAATSDVTFTKKGTVQDVNAGVQITHTDTGDLDLWLMKGETYIPLAFSEQGSGTNDDNYGGGTGCTGGITVFDNQATLSIFDGINPFAGSFRPTGNAGSSLREFIGEKVNGTWRLAVIDDDSTGGDVGTINCLQITAKYKK